MVDKLLTKIANTDFQKVFNKLGYAYFTKGYYNLNIIGIRRSGNKVTNLFDDYLVVIYNTPKNGTIRVIYNITTDPGVTSMTKPINYNGAAILVPSQYRGTWKIGKHKGKYEALTQYKPVKVYRDNNKNKIYDFNPVTIQNGIFGINIHKAGENSTYVNDWSAGCQVFKNSNDFRSFMRLCKEQVTRGLGETFTYTLLKEEQL